MKINGNQGFLRTHPIWRGIFSQAKQARNEHFVLIFRAPVDFPTLLSIVGVLQRNTHQKRFKIGDGKKDFNRLLEICWTP